MEQSSSMSEKRACDMGQRSGYYGLRKTTINTRPLTDSLSEAEELRGLTWLRQSDWLVRVERRVEWKLLLPSRSRALRQSSAPR